MAEVTNKTAQEADEAHAFLSQKLEKIAHALYLITSSFPPDEPLRSALRNLSVSLLRMRQSFSGNAPIGAESTYTLSDVLIELQSLVGLARTSRLMSAANAEILSGEISKLLDAGKDVYGEPLLSAGDLSVSGDIQALKAITPDSTPQKKDSTKPQKDDTRAPKERPESISKAKKRRREAILEALDDMGEVGIKEISKEVRGCSRKTIQRELSALVDQGLVVKEGERRWSTYLLTSEGRAAVGS